MRLLLVASDPMEFTGIVAHAQDSQPALVRVDWACSARLAGHDVLLVANGVGSKRAAAAVDASASFRPDAVISTGFCGALAEDLKVGDIVVGTCIAKHTGKDACSTSTWPAQQPECLPGQGWRRRFRVRSGPICSIDHVAQTSQEKRRLHLTGACAVEMEAAGVAERAQALGLPFHCVKAVTDLAGETMANDFNAALRSDGHFDTMLILRGSLRHPAIRIPELLRLRNRCVRAARILGEFFADCRF
ncbi:MAG: hypothetical protein LAQ69_11075 [Acidobacteriia bacterium]|nr:hypothetical protein [Terriglobia bacterium]